MVIISPQAHFNRPARAEHFFLRLKAQENISFRDHGNFQYTAGFSNPTTNSAVMHYRAAATDEDLRHILALQHINLPANISAAEAREQGFVTVHHDLELLRAMNDPYGHATAWEGDVLAGYALVMPREFGNRIPVLIPMFERMNDIRLADGRRLGNLEYIVMGQVAVARGFRGSGVFAGLYDDLRRRLRLHFEALVTEIATRNTRSWRAHAKVGFEDWEIYTDPDGEEWVIVGWML